MKNENYNKKTLTDYLLGKLSQFDAEKFDELSITDDNFADELRVVEDDLVDAYLHGELENDDLARFEANYLASPLRREKVEFARALQIIASKNVVKPVEETKTSTGFFASWNIFRNFNSALRFSFATLLLTFVGVFGWFLLSKNNKPNELVKIEPIPTIQPSTTPTQTPISNQTTPTPTVSPKNTNAAKTPDLKISLTNSPTPQPTVEPTKLPTPTIATLATFILLPPTRGGSSLQTISITKQTTDIAFGLPLEAADFKSYRVFLKNQTGKILWQSGKLTSKKSALNVRLSAKLLQSNIYSLTVVGIDEANEPENIGDYSFKSVIK